MNEQLFVRLSLSHNTQLLQKRLNLKKYYYAFPDIDIHTIHLGYVYSRTYFVLIYQYFMQHTHLSRSSFKSCDRQVPLMTSSRQSFDSLAKLEIESLLPRTNLQYPSCFLKMNVPVESDKPYSLQSPQA